MMNWKQLRKELQTEFGRDGVEYYNDKNKYTRRIKIYGENKYKIQTYLQSKYPNLTMWETNFKTPYYQGYFNGICFNLAH